MTLQVPMSRGKSPKEQFSITHQLQFNVRKNNALLNLKPENVGKNIFDEILLFENSAAFRRRVEDFKIPQVKNKSVLCNLDYGKKFADIFSLNIHCGKNLSMWLKQFGRKFNF